MRKNKYIYLAGASLIFNFIFLYVLYTNLQPASKKTPETSTQYSYPYLSKRIFAENQNDILINFIPLRQSMREYINKQEGKVGTYFEYLPSGVSIGVNDKVEIRLASLSKVPIVMSIFKKIERGQMSPSDMLVIEKTHLDQGFGNLWKRGEGAELSVQELIELSLIESDNTAYNVLLGQLTGQELNEVYKNLDISITVDIGEDEKYLRVSPKNYSSIFRSLYLASFLSKENSNHILKLLTQTAFKDKIADGVPDTIKVAHKIGTFEEVDTLQNVFIDCGIIYIPNRPYILCAFVLDTNEEAQKHMLYISKTIYEYITKVKGGN